ncbi:hypothetical protein N7G274_008127 [Stereocaulon virgatum]|uniref:Uncharacterized protein n=1 Tax=Stereocaulon virgatum TaxID=373712 RepID=A0ABR4A218_9LECA
MAPSQLPPTFGQNINTDMKLLWPDRDLELDFCTDDYEIYYAHILEVCGDSHSQQWYTPFLLDCVGGTSFEDAAEKIHNNVKNALLKKLGAK